MSGLLRELAVPQVDHNLDVGSADPVTQTALIVQAVGTVIQEESPDTVCVFGDTNSTLGGGIAAAKAATALVHIEAGCRSFDRRMPEEINRRAVDHVADPAARGIGARRPQSGTGARAGRGPHRRRSAARRLPGQHAVARRGTCRRQGVARSIARRTQTILCDSLRYSARSPRQIRDALDVPRSSANRKVAGLHPRFDQDGRADAVQRPPRGAPVVQHLRHELPEGFRRRHSGPPFPVSRFARQRSGWRRLQAVRTSSPRPRVFSPPS